LGIIVKLQNSNEEYYNIYIMTRFVFPSPVLVMHSVNSETGRKG